MSRKAKLPFDPKVFLSKVNGGRAISDYRKDQIDQKCSFAGVPVGGAGSGRP